MELLIPWKTFLKIFAAAALVFVALKTAPLLLLVLLGIMMAVTLHPALAWLRRHGFPRWAGVALIALLLVAVFVGFMVGLVPPLIQQGGEISKRVPELKDSLMSHVPRSSGLHRVVDHYFSAGAKADPEAWVARIVLGLTWALGGLSELVLWMIFSIYFLVDGPRAYAWFLAFFSDANRAKVHQTSEEVSRVIFAYVAGQFITSFLCSLYTLVVLSALKVPGALILAVMAGVFDILPIIGFFLFTLPAVALALTVSVSTAMWVAVLFIAYHGIENYLIVPRVYGNRLRVSGLAVLLGLLVGALVARIEGAIAVLPIVASYPIIERIWLVKTLGQKVVEKHVEQSRDESAPAPLKKLETSLT